MKKVLIVLMLAFCLSSCIPPSPTYQQVCKCENQDIKDLFNQIANVLLKEGYTITKNEQASGFIEAETNRELNIWVGYNMWWRWSIQYEHGQIKAYCTYNGENNGLYHNTITESIGDKVPESKGEYWNVKDELEKICNSKITINNILPEGRRKTKKDKKDNKSDTTQTGVSEPD